MLLTTLPHRVGLRISEQGNLKGTLSPVLVQEFCTVIEKLSDSTEWMVMVAGRVRREREMYKAKECTWFSFLCIYNVYIYRDKSPLVFIKYIYISFTDYFCQCL